MTPSLHDAMTPPPHPAVSRVVKDIAERLIAAAALVFLSPLLVVIVLAVCATSAGPVIYRRRVLGRGGREFEAFKFRTMVADADAVLRAQPKLLAAYERNVKLAGDPRVTAVGRWLRAFSLDELPQLVNVLRGEMSLVGPRMIAPDEAARYGTALAKRLTVKPGITGLWQVSGRQELDYAERIRLDLEYIDNWSLRLDAVILLKTIPAVLSTRGAL
jgi:lipopolysaccharide/colanic/teichoic acid biosynthesis glycosyltransferase